MVSCCDDGPWCAQTGPREAGGPFHPVVRSSLQSEASEEQQPVAQQSTSQPREFRYGVFRSAEMCFRWERKAAPSHWERPESNEDPLLIIMTPNWLRYDGCSAVVSVSSSSQAGWTNCLHSSARVARRHNCCKNVDYRPQSAWTDLLFITFMNLDKCPRTWCHVGAHQEVFKSELKHTPFLHWRTLLYCLTFIVFFIVILFFIILCYCIVNWW